LKANKIKITIIKIKHNKIEKIKIDKQNLIAYAKMNCILTEKKKEGCTFYYIVYFTYNMRIDGFKRKIILRVYYFK